MTFPTLKVRSQIGNFTPRSIARLFYVALFVLYRRRVQRKTSLEKSSIWYRNSLALGRARFAASDLDISLLLRDQAQVERALCCRNLSPLVKEVHYYLASDLHLVSQFINPHELKRDPTLRDVLRERGLLGPRQLDEPSRSASFVYLLRFLETRWPSDSPSQRHWQEKWRYHLAACGLTSRSVDPFEQLLELVPEDERDLLRRSLFVYREFRESQGVDLQQFFRRQLPQLAPQLASILLALLPHRFCYVQDLATGNVAAQSAPFVDIFIEQLHWEVWGLLTQLPVLSVDRGLYEHLCRLERLLEPFAESSHRDLRQGLEVLKKRSLPGQLALTAET